MILLWKTTDYRALVTGNSGQVMVPCEMAQLYILP